MKYLAIILFVSSLFAGQSIQYGTQVIYDETMPTTSTNRVETWICWTTTGTTTHVISGPGGAFGNGAYGWLMYLQPGPPFNLAISQPWDNGAPVTVDVTGVSNSCVLVRLQHDPAGAVGVAKTDYYEIWDAATGSRYFWSAMPYTSETASGIGIQMGFSNEPTVDVAFLRASTTLVPLNSTPPTTFSTDPNRVFEWKFDCTGGLAGCPTGGLADATGHGYTATYDTGSTPTYIDTTFQTPHSVPQANARVYTNTTSTRAGYAIPLVGGNSYSQADSSATVTCFWQQTYGPSQWVWPTGHTSCSPAPIGATWGEYGIQLTVTDTNGATDTETTPVGSVAQDSKGVVVNADPNADIIFGPMLAYGQNPWGLADQWEYNSSLYRCANYGLSSGCVSPVTSPLSYAALQWNQTGAGTVAYTWGGVGTGTAGGLSCSNVTTGGTMTTTQTTVPISNSACVDTSTLPTTPTHIVLGTGTGAEDIRICSVTAGTPPAETLNVCYDGRGYLSPATGWAAGTGVQQYKVTGSGTNFQTDANAAVCPIGLPAPTGPSYYSTGTITLTAGSATVMGSGTTFTSAMAGVNGSYLVVTATHSGTPYVFIRQIAIYNSPTSITLTTAFPSDSDTGSYSYNITAGQRTLDLRGNHSVDTSSLGQFLWNAPECESATTLYLNPWVSGNEFASGHSPGFNVGAPFSGLPYSVTDVCCYMNNGTLGGINFYGESGAWRKGWLKSGLNSFGAAANVIDNYLVNSPWGQANTEGNGVFELESGGAAIMAFASAVLGAGNGPGAGQGASWGDLRSYAQAGYNNVTGIYNDGVHFQCWTQDTRSNSYAEAWLVLAALYDPDTSTNGWRSQWISDLTEMQAVDSACHQGDYSWSQAALCCTGSVAFGPVTLTNNSIAMTGTLTLNGGGSACTGTGYGTGTVTNGSGLLTISTTTAGSISGSDAFAITGTMGGQPYTIQMMYSAVGGPIQLAGLWPGDTGAVNWMAVNTSNVANNLTSYGTDPSDTGNLIQDYDCYVTGSGTAVLDHPWAGANGSAYLGQLYVLTGYGQQPFYNGINIFRMRLLANSSLSSASFYQGLINNTFNWIKNTGYNSTGLYTNYGAVFSFCATGNLLVTNPALANTVAGLSPGCNYPILPSQPTYMATDRAQNSELGIACAAYYQQNPTSGNKTFCDQLYGAVWGNQAYNTGGAYYDQYSSGGGAPFDRGTNYGVSNLSPASQANEKWPGFFCGMGSCDQWPAFALGGVDPPNVITISVPYSLTGVTNAAKVKMTVTEPNGVATPVTCTSSPCAVSVDFRQGNPLLKIDYENSSNAIIAPGDPFPWHIAVP